MLVCLLALVVVLNTGFVFFVMSICSLCVIASCCGGAVLFICSLFFVFVASLFVLLFLGHLGRVLFRVSPIDPPK